MRYLSKLSIYFLYSLFGLGVLGNTRAQTAQKKSTTGIQWISLQEMQERQKTEPRWVYIELYAEQDGWCKQMLKKTLANRHVSDFVNQNFYAVRLDAGTKDSLEFQGKWYQHLPDHEIHELAAQWMQHTIQFPFRVFYDPQFKQSLPVPGFLDLPTMELTLRYLIEGKPKKLSFDQFRQHFKASW